MKKHIPNALTCCNLLCGCVGVTEVFNDHLITASWLIYAAALFDFLDGFTARALKVQSAIGKELDSLADMVSFGLLPGMILYRLMPETAGYSTYIAFLIPIFSALRLAKFNTDTRQSDSFIGVPTPANALLISSFPFIVSQQSWGFGLLQQWSVLALVAVLMSWLMIAELPLIALKFKSYTWQANKFQYILISTSVILFFAFNFAAIPIVILLYILLSLLHSLSPKTKQT